MKRKIMELLFLFAILLGFWGLLWQIHQERQLAQAKLASQVIRLHILANSDSPQDQQVKLLIRDQVTQYIQKHSAGLEDKADAASFLQNHTKDLTSIADHILDEEELPYRSKAVLTTCYFPDKTYGTAYDTAFFPAGEYDAFRLILGSGDGKNWWCVLYPPLCFLDGAVSEEPASPTPKPIQTGIGGNTPQYHIRFKFLIFLNDLFH